MCGAFIPFEKKFVVSGSLYHRITVCGFAWQCGNCPLSGLSGLRSNLGGKAVSIFLCGRAVTLYCVYTMSWTGFWQFVCTVCTLCNLTGLLAWCKPSQIQLYLSWIRQNIVFKNGSTFYSNSFKSFAILSWDSKLSLVSKFIFQLNLSNLSKKPETDTPLLDQNFFLQILKSDQQKSLVNEYAKASFYLKNKQ